MAHNRSAHWKMIKEQGFIPLCGDWNADETEVICEIFVDSGFGAAECIACRQAYRKDDQGNIEYFR